jgi:hypothetical protein
VKICPEHNQPCLMFCKDHCVAICTLCTFSSHKVCMLLMLFICFLYLSSVVYMFFVIYVWQRHAKSNSNNVPSRSCRDMTFLLFLTTLLPAKID